MASFGNRVFVDVVKRRSSGWVLAQSDGCPYKKGKSGYVDRHTHTERQRQRWG